MNFNSFDDNFNFSDNAGNDPDGKIVDKLRNDILNPIKGCLENKKDNNEQSGVDYEYYYENWQYLNKLKDIKEAIDNIQIKDDCPNKETAQEKLDEWKEDVYSELKRLKEYIKSYCRSIDSFNNIWNDNQGRVTEELMQADTLRRKNHDALIDELCIVVKFLKLNFFSPDKTNFIKSVGLNENAFLNSNEINKIDTIEFVPKEFYIEGGYLLNSKVLKQGNYRELVTNYAITLYNEFKEEEKIEKK